jgi:chemotaxis protein MotB
LDKTKRHFETNLMDLKEQRVDQEQKIIEQRNIIAELDASRLTQEQKIIEQRNIIAELDASRLTIEDTLQYRQSQLKLRGKKIKALENAIAQLDKTKHQIETNLQKQIKAQQVKLEEVEGKLKVTFVDKILFNSGSVRINQEGKDLLLTLTESFKQNKNHNIIVQGHTDNVLIKTEFREIYPTNWELSAARSAAVVRYFQDKAGIDPERLVASGYSFYKPIASNLTQEGQQQNRRIEIILTPPR